MESTSQISPGVNEESSARSCDRGLAGKIRKVVTNPDAHKSFFSLCDQALVSGTNFLTVVIIGRNCLPEELGIYHLLFSVILMSTLIQDSLISGPYRIYLKKRFGQERDIYTGSVIFHQILVSLLLIGVVIGIMTGSWFGYLAEGLFTASIPLLFLIPFILMRDFLRRISFAHLQFKIAALVDFTVATIQISSLLLLAYYNQLSITTAFLVIGIGCLFSCVVWYAIKPVRKELSRQHFIKDWLQNWKFSKWSMGSMLIANLPPVLFLPWFLAMYDGETATGILAASFMIVGIVNVFLSAIDNMIGPRSAHELHDGGPKSMMKLINKATAILSFLMLLFVIGLTIYGESIALYVFGDQYLEFSRLMGWVIFVQSIHFLAIAAGIGATNGLWALERPNDNFYSSIGDMLATVLVAILFVVLISTGPLGVALATAAGTITGTALRWYYLKKALAQNINFNG